MRTAIGPLVHGATYRRGVHLLLGGVVALPYVLLGLTFVQMFANPAVPVPALVLLLLATVLIGTVPAFLGGARALEIAAARALLDVDLPDPVSRRLDGETRLRGALWFVGHLIIGGLVALALLIALPMSLVFVTSELGIGREALAGLRIGPFDEHDTGWLTILGLILLVGLAYLVAGVGALAAMLAPALLGPSQTERIEALEVKASRLAERNRLARELHDSVGHSLTITIMQASAADELFDRDPEFVRRALQSIVEAGRSAMVDLDYALGVLRDGVSRDGVSRHGSIPDEGASTEPRRAPQRSLAELGRLVADTRATGLPVALEVVGSLDRLPASISREGYRIVQEGLTNATRHAAPLPVAMRLAVTGDSLTIDMSNPIAVAPPAATSRSCTTVRRTGRTGQGLAGIEERVRLLGGWMTAGEADGTWRVRVELPARPERAG